MRLILEVQAGPDAPRTITVAARSTVVVGRKAPAQVVLADPTVSRTHFSLEFDGRSCRLKDLGSTHGTVINAAAVSESILLAGDLIQVGQTVLKVTFSETDAPVAPRSAAPATSLAETLDEIPTIPTLHDQVAATLGAERGSLYAILDSAREPLVLARLIGCKGEYKSLYAGVKGDALADVAPYLVSLPGGAPFLTTIVRDGWGKSWGIYLTSPEPFAAVRKHFRHFLLVADPSGAQVIFRYYDPRVLRVYLPTCTPDELAEVFGPIQAFLLESDDPGVLLRFRLHRGGLMTEKVVFADPAVEAIDEVERAGAFA